MEEEDLKLKCIGRYRLDDEQDEVKTMNWLLKCSMTNNQNNLQSLKQMILCMDLNHQNYGHLSKSERLLAMKLNQAEDAVEITLITIFRWLGTHVGQFEMNKLMKELQSNTSGADEKQ